MKRLLVKKAAIAATAILISTAAYAEPYRVAVSNSYIGNEWRVEMINFMHSYTAKYLKDEVVLTVNNSGTDAQKQIAVISDMISDGVDAILINPASDTALNAVIEEASKQGILVIAFDQPVTAPSAYTVTVDFVELGEIHAQWLVDTLAAARAMWSSIAAFQVSLRIKTSIRVRAMCSTNIRISKSLAKSMASGTMRSASKS